MVVPGRKFAKVDMEGTSDCPMCQRPLVGACVELEGAKKRILHTEKCFSCSVCGRGFSNQYWQFQGALMCRDDYMKAAGLSCKACGLVVKDKALVKAMGSILAPKLFCVLSLQGAF